MLLSKTVVSALILIAHPAHRLHGHAIGRANHPDSLDGVAIARQLWLAKLILRLRLGMLARREIKLAGSTHSDLTWLLEAVLRAFLASDVGHAGHVLVVLIGLRTSPCMLAFHVGPLRGARRLILARQDLVGIDNSVASRSSPSHRVEIIRAHATRRVEESASEIL